MGKSYKPIVVLCLFLLIITSSAVHAYWVSDGAAICTASYTQGYPEIIADGDGGAVVVWRDRRAHPSYSDIYARRADPTGVLKWGTNGRIVCGLTMQSQLGQRLISTGDGGAFIAWTDWRDENPGVYLQRVSGSGVSQWTANGIKVCSDTISGGNARLVSDGAGGVIITWSDSRDYDTSKTNIYAQRVDADGALQWALSGAVVCTNIFSQSLPEIISDGAGGAIITWEDSRDGDYRTYAQRIDPNGNVLWVANGVALSTYASNQRFHRIVSDDAGGAIVAWVESRNGNDIYAQRVNANGVLQWATGGVAICSAANNQNRMYMDSDGAGGAVLVWNDDRRGDMTSYGDVYVQRISNAGFVHWAANGVAACIQEVTGITYPDITSDGAGGAIVTWTDGRNLSADIYAQKINAGGTAAWTTNGVAICLAEYTQLRSRIVSDDAGGAIIVWEDGRNDEWDIYMQRVYHDGYCGVARPEVVSTNPVINELDVSVGTDILVTFNMDMDEATIDASTFVVYTSSSGLHSGDVSYKSLTRSASFEPAEDFKEGDLVTVTLTESIESSDGIHLVSYVWSFTTEANTGSGTFSTPSDYDVGEYPVSIFAADLDGDGDQDMAVANSVTSDEYWDVSVLLNNGDGTFGSQMTYRTDISPRSVFASDFDADGDLDLATANYGSNNVSILMNNGNGTFSSQVVYTVGVGPKSIFASDLDGDGYIDITIANEYSNNVSVLMNNGNGTFAASTVFAVADYPCWVYAADFDCDGDMDIATLNNVTDEVSVLRNNGDGTFESHVEYGVGDTPYSLSVADLDGDGDLEIVTANYYGDDVSVLLNNGNGTFASHVGFTVGDGPHYVFAADFDGDGDQDLATSNRSASSVSILLNNGDCTFSTHNDFTTGYGSSAVFAADFNGDGNIDLATANTPSGDVSVLMNMITPQILSTTPSQNELNVPGSANISVTFDVDMDETSINTGTFVVNARSTGLLVGTITYDSPSKTATFNPKDNFDDGELVSVSLLSDIESAQGFAMEASYVWSFTTVAGEGPGEFISDVEYSTGSRPRSVFAADFEGDGDIDLVVANRNSHTVSVKFNNGFGEYPFHATYSVGSYPLYVFSADLDGDGDMDLATSNSDDDNVSILLNNGSGTFASRVDYSVGNSPSCLAGGDLDGDGDMDLVTGNTWNISVLLNNGNGTFAAHADYDAGYAAGSVCAFDFDGDGDLDVGVANYVDDTITLMTNNGHGILTLYQTYATGESPGCLFPADLDDDGDLDIAVANRMVNTISVMMNNGDGTLSAQVTYPTGSGPVEVFAADFDGDSDLDLATCNYNSNNVTVLLNNGSGIFTYGGEYLAGTGPFSLFAADFDGDSTMDLAVANFSSASVSVLLNRAVYIVSLPITVTGVDIPFISGPDTLAIVNFASETLDSLRIQAFMDTRPPDIPSRTYWVRRYYEITPYPSGAAFEADITLYYAQTEFDDSGLSEEWALHPYRYDEGGDTWEIQNGSVNITENSVYCAGVTEFSIWGFSNTKALVDDELDELPQATALHQNYPNPFNPATQIRYMLHRDSDVKLAVFDVLGRKVAVLVDGKQTAGSRTVAWNGTDSAGGQVASGVYFYRLVAGDFVQTRKMVLLR